MTHCDDSFHSSQPKSYNEHCVASNRCDKELNLQTIFQSIKLVPPIDPMKNELKTLSISILDVKKMY